MAFSSSDTDAEKNMVILFQQGEIGSYNNLYNKYAPAILGVLIRTIGDQQLAEECMQAAFIKIWAERQNYNPSKERLFTWLLKIAKSCVANIPAVQKKYVDEEIREEINLVCATDIKAYLMEKKQLEGENFAAGIDKSVKQAMQLVYFESCSFTAAAEKAGLSAEILRRKIVMTIKQLKGSQLA